MNPEPRMVSLAYLAKEWGISRSGVWNYIKRGKLPKGKRVGRGYVYPIDTPRPAPLTRNKRGGRSNTQVPLDTSSHFGGMGGWAMWPAPERAL